MPSKSQRSPAGQAIDNELAPMHDMTTASPPLPSTPAARGTSRPARLAACLAVAGATVLIGGCDGSDGQPATGDETATHRQTAFRVRADATTDLNADAGWAGDLNEDVTVHVDEPFRLRFELESANGALAEQSFRLQHRRNGGEWQMVGAENFPQPEKALAIDFRVDAPPEPSDHWRLARGDAAALTIERGGESSLHLSGTRGEVLALGRFELNWRPVELATVMRLAGDPGARAGLVFGYQDQSNHYRVQIDPAGSMQVTRLVDGNESRLAETGLPFSPGQWFELKVETVDGGIAIEAERGDQAVGLTVDADVQLEAPGAGLHVAAGGEAWVRAFRIEGEPRSPRVSVVASTGYRHGEATTDRLAGSRAPFAGGAGIGFADRTPPAAGEGGQSEWEWPLVIRRFADGAVMNRDGDLFEFRMAAADGSPVAGDHPALRLAVPDGHLGGTFVETPGRIGPWQAANGDLYFLMEPAETFNVLMTVKSSDGGRSWREVDGDHRPATNDLEGFASTQVGDTIHMVHQTSDAVWYHAFRTSDHRAEPDTWSVRDEWVAAPAEPPTQVADIAVRSDGSILVVYGGPEKIHYKTRSPAGEWGEETVIDAEVARGLSGPMMVRGADDVIHLAYTGSDGTAWYRRLDPHGELTARELLATGLGTGSEDVGSILPLVYLPEGNTVSLIYRLASGLLQERRSVAHGPLTEALAVTDRAVVQNAVDADQTGADAIADGESIHVLFIDQESRQIFHTHRDRDGHWAAATRQTEGVTAQWVRGARLVHGETRVYGYVFDAGSDGGSGKNRYAQIVLDD
jgi:hypothetical protein